MKALVANLAFLLAMHLTLASSSAFALPPSIPPSQWEPPSEGFVCTSTQLIGGATITKRLLLVHFTHTSVRLACWGDELDPCTMPDKNDPENIMNLTAKDQGFEISGIYTYPGFNGTSEFLAQFEPEDARLRIEKGSMMRTYICAPRASHSLFDSVL